jgi:hypothetical protein
MGFPTVFPKLRGAGVPEHVARAQDNVDTALRTTAQSVAVTPIGGAAPPGWVKPDQLTGGYAQTALPQPVVSFHKDALGYVHTKLGLTHAAGTAAGAIAFTYPLAYRPTETLTFILSDAAGANSTIQVAANGQLTNVAALAAGAQIRGYFIFRPGT